MSRLQEGRAWAWPNSRNMAIVNLIKQENHKSLGRHVRVGSRTPLVCWGLREAGRGSAQCPRLQDPPVPSGPCSPQPRLHGLKIPLAAGFQ